MQTFMEASPEQLAEVVQTNLLGTMLCTRAAVRALAGQPKGGHIFNMDGAGANNLPSPMYAAYGATKAGSLRLRPPTFYLESGARWLTQFLCSMDELAISCPSLAHV